jgi:hypothetical protein
MEKRDLGSEMMMRGIVENIVETESSKLGLFEEVGKERAVAAFHETVCADTSKVRIDTQDACFPGFLSAV